MMRPVVSTPRRRRLHQQTPLGFHGQKNRAAVVGCPHHIEGVLCACEAPRYRYLVSTAFLLGPFIRMAAENSIQKMR